MKRIVFALALIGFQPAELLAQNEPKLVIPIGHEEMEVASGTSSVNMAKFSPDDQLIITAGGDNTAKIWSAATGMLLYNLKGHDKPVNAVDFSADGKLALTASDDGLAITWDVAAGKSKLQLPNKDRIATARFFARGNRVLTSPKDGSHLYSSVWMLQIDSTGKSFLGNLAQLSPDEKKICTSRSDFATVWNLDGRPPVNLEGHTDRIRTIEFSADGKKVITLSDDLTAKVWDALTGMALQTLPLGRVYVHDFVHFHPSGQWVVTGAYDRVTLWDRGTGKEIYSKSDTSSVESGDFSEDGKLFAVATLRGLKVYEATSGRELWRLNSGEIWPTFVSFSHSGSKVLAAYTNAKVVVYDALTGKVLQTLEGKTPRINKVALTPDGNAVLESLTEGIVERDLLSGNIIHHYDHRSIFSGGNAFTSGILSARLTPTGNLMVGEMFGYYIVWETATGKVSYYQDNGIRDQWAVSPDRSKVVMYSRQELTAWVCDITQPQHKLLFELPHTESINHAEFSPDGKKLATASDDKTVVLWNGSTGAKEKTLNLKTAAQGVQFSADGALLLTYNLYGEADDSRKVIDRGGIKIWNTTSGKLVDTFEKEELMYNNEMAMPGLLSPDGKMIAIALWDTIRLYSYPEKKVLRELNAGSVNDIQKMFFSPDGSRLIANFENNISKGWDTKTGERKLYFNGVIESADWKKGMLLLRDNSRLVYYDLNADETKLAWVNVGNGEWVVTHKSGLFDASPGAMDKLYFAQGLDIIDFNQLKERYYEPGLWKKVMAGEPLRNVTGMKSIELPPDIQVGQVDGEGYLMINLTNRGGGIGEVNVFVNGKEVIKDARDANVKPDASNASLKVFVGKHKSIMKGQENFIGVKAWNKDHWVQSRGQIVSYQSKEMEQYKPAVHLLTCGVSDYTGTEIDLKYAAKDANDMGVALQLGAKKLFGADRSYVYNLTTTQSKEFYPTKTNILKAFEKISATAHPLDIFVMYVSGHGINYGGQDGDWHYLTQEAYTGSASAYNDPAIRAQTTISSNELVELFKKVPALKQVLILDACASGKVVDNLMAQKDIESSTIRALDRMRDRTGMHIITGCTADAVSYEASKYGQGVLTYSLLEGIRGAALREDQFVDVNKLFQYAQDRVPQLAGGIGGIQSPQVFSPQGSQSFDIGLLTTTEKSAIPIAKIRPVYIRSNFQDENEMEDVLNIGKAIDESLSEASAKGADATLIFVDVRDYPDACKLIGRYKKEGGQIMLKLRRKCGGEDQTFEVTAPSVEMLKGEVLKKL